MFNPRVSVVVPVFNRTSFIRFAILSILEQTYQDFEIIVVDDGSTDGKGLHDLVLSFNDPRIRYLQKTNGGVASAINYGINQMKGDYFAWLSDDDMFNPLHLETAVRLLSDHEEPTMYFSNWEYVNSSGNSLDVIDKAHEQLHLLVTDLGPIERGLISLISSVISKDVFEVVGVFDENLKYVQDYEFCLRASIAEVSWEFSSYVGGRVRLHSGQMSKSKESNAEEWNFWKSVACVGAKQIVSKYGETETKEELISFRNYFQQTERFGAVEYLDSILLEMYKELP